MRPGPHYSDGWSYPLNTAQERSPVTLTDTQLTRTRERPRALLVDRVHLAGGEGEAAALALGADPAGDVVSHTDLDA